MSFWSFSSEDNNKVAIIDQTYNISKTYKDFQDDIDVFHQHLEGNSKKLVFILCSNSYPSLIGLMAFFQKNDAVCLLDSEINTLLLNNLIANYEPEWMWTPDSLEIPSGYYFAFKQFNYHLLRRSSEKGQPIHSDLALLLSTSGTTGSPKMVKLSYLNIQSNADSIASYLNIKSDDRAITTLPIHYSYGFSIVSSHLLAKATILLTNESVMSKKFWEFFQSNLATSMAGVPYTYQILKRLQFDKMELKSLRTMTQAGGRLDTQLQKYFYETGLVKGYKFFVMYGQTEATARISYVPPERLENNFGTIGLAIPGGRLEIDGTTNELIYYGPNVMMGYGLNRADLITPDELKGRLETGDIAEIKEGLFYIIGRKKRFLKLFGLRVNMDEIEKFIEKQTSINCYCIGDDTKMVIVVENPNFIDNVNLLIAENFKIHHSSFSVKFEKEIPHLANGKVDYNLLWRRVNNHELR